MEMLVVGWGKVMNYEQEIVEVVYFVICLFQVKKNIFLVLFKEVEFILGGWQECLFVMVFEFFVLVYFYVCVLWKELNVLIGVIDCIWGGMFVEVWMSYEILW